MAFSSYTNKLKGGFAFLLIHSGLATLSFSFVPIFLFEQSFALWQLIMLFATYCAIAVISISIVNKYDIRKFMITGLIVYGLSILSLLLNKNIALYFYVILMGIAMIFFWIPLNYIFFKSSKKNTNASDSSWYLILPGVLGMILPPIAALMIKNIGYSWLFISVFILYLISAYLVRNLIPDEKIIAPTIECIQRYKGLKTITLFEGSLHFLSFGVLPIYSLFFLKTENELGLFLSYLGLVGLIIAIILAKRSDESLERKNYIYFLGVPMIISVALMAFSSTKTQWIIIMGFYTIFYNISFPLRTAIVIDHKKADLALWKAREILLNVGRVITLSISAVLFYYELYKYVFFMYAIMIFVYLIFINYKIGDIRSEKV